MAESPRPIGAMKSMDSPERSPVMMRALILALMAWGALLGLGAYLGLDDQTPSRDVRRLFVVAASIGLFLAIWLCALLLRGRRKRLERIKRQQAADSD